MSQSENTNLEAMGRAAVNASRLMKTLSHPGRLMILCHIADRERSVGDLAELLQMPQSTLSQQLARLRAERLVDTRRDAQTVYYSLHDGKVRYVIETLYELYCRDGSDPATIDGSDPRRA